MEYKITDKVPVPGTPKAAVGRKNRHKALAIETMVPGQSVCLEKLGMKTRSALSKVKLHENSIKCLLRDKNIANLNYKVDFYANRRIKEIRLWILDPVTV